jgi:hypothetical protein
MFSQVYATGAVVGVGVGVGVALAVVGSGVGLGDVAGVPGPQAVSVRIRRAGTASAASFMCGC